MARGTFLNLTKLAALIMILCHLSFITTFAKNFVIFSFSQFLLQMSTIQTIKTTTGTTPYTTILRVRVALVSPSGWVNYTSSSGQKAHKLSCMLVDKTGSARCVAYDKKFEPTLLEGRSVALKNFVYRDGLIRLTTQSHVLRYA